MRGFAPGLVLGLVLLVLGVWVTRSSAALVSFNTSVGNSCYFDGRCDFADGTIWNGGVAPGALPSWPLFFCLSFISALSLQSFAVAKQVFAKCRLSHRLIYACTVNGDDVLVQLSLADLRQATQVWLTVSSSYQLASVTLRAPQKDGPVDSTAAYLALDVRTYFNSSGSFSADGSVFIQIGFGAFSAGNCSLLLFSQDQTYLVGHDLLLFVPVTLSNSVVVSAPTDSSATVTDEFVVYRSSVSFARITAKHLLVNASQFSMSPTRGSDSSLERITVTSGSSFSQLAGGILAGSVLVSDSNFTTASYTLLRAQSMKVYNARQLALLGNLEAPAIEPFHILLSNCTSKLTPIIISSDVNITITGGKATLGQPPYKAVSRAVLDIAAIGDATLEVRGFDSGGAFAHIVLHNASTLRLPAHYGSSFVEGSIEFADSTCGVDVPYLGSSFHLSGGVTLNNNAFRYVGEFPHYYSSFRYSLFTCYMCKAMAGRFASSDVLYPDVDFATTFDFKYDNARVEYLVLTQTWQAWYYVSILIIIVASLALFGLTLWCGLLCARSNNNLGDTDMFGRLVGGSGNAAYAPIQNSGAHDN